MNSNDRAFDLAEELAEKERQTAIRHVQQALSHEGAFDCRDCPNEIEPARREAMPSAVRCIACQRRYERASRSRR
ncbi:TraR/DksA C4-type zinc finger protein